MKKLLIVFLMMFSVIANAGLKTSVGIENYEAIKVSTKICQSGYNGLTGQPYSNCSGYVEKERVSTIRGSVGYEIDLGSKYSVETKIGLNTLFNAQAEVNGLYKINDKIKAKAGVNTSQDLSNGALANVKPGMGVQVGAEYSLTDKMALTGTVGTKSQVYEIKGLQGEHNGSTTAANVGISFKF